MAPKIPLYIKSRKSYFKSELFKSESGSIFLVILFGIGITVLGLEILKKEYGGIKNVLRSYANEGAGYFFDLSDIASSEKVARDDLMVEKRILDKKTIVEIGPGALNGVPREVKRGRLGEQSPAKQSSLSNYWESFKESLAEKREPRNYQNKEARPSWIDNFKKNRQQNLKEKKATEFQQNERSDFGRFIEDF